ncbi:hypothetical protein [Geodermatophilus chilensis]|uniref:hypothetical protein n=1 Tax=Geodermatophilus chilensis TaxID=2035835 RepID=UPI0012FFFD58|nr:hypothetical protein [Geodermatophilus chilensis]
MTTFDAEMRAFLATGAPLLDNPSDGTPDGPGTCTCRLIPGEHPENECGALSWKAIR